MSQLTGYSDSGGSYALAQKVDALAIAFTHFSNEEILTIQLSYIQPA